MSNKKKETFVDDGRTIVNMNVEGMPWHLDGPRVGKGPKQPGENERQPEDLQLTKKETRAIIKGVMMVTLPIVLIFTLSYFFIFLFLDWFWL